VGSGLIPPLHRPPSRLDESLALAFGPYPLLYRNGLGAPRRGIAILEIGKLEGSLEAALRNPRSRDAAIAAIAERVVDALQQGLAPTGLAQEALEPAGVAISPPPDGVRSDPQANRPPTSSGGE
jgi:hypothetical protein